LRQNLLAQILIRFSVAIYTFDPFVAAGDSNVVTKPTWVLLAEKEWLNRMQPEDFRVLTLLFYGQINPYGG
jgi:hypothetical protein